MRVFSDFHDYYDIGLTYGIDPKCVYTRKSVKVRYKGDTGYNPSWFHLIMTDSHFRQITDELKGVYWNKNPKSDRHILLFCGKLYLGIEYDGVVCWSFERLQDEIKKKKNKNDIKTILDQSQTRGRFYWGRWDRPRGRELKRIFEAVENLSGASKFLNDILVMAGVPIIDFLTDYYVTATLNPELKKIGFASVKDAYTAFQELSMYLTNVITIPENPMCEIDDLSKAIEHGYNEKSFRNPIRL